MFLIPVLGGIIADSWLGRYRTTCCAVSIDLCGLLLLFVASLPYSLEHGAGLGGFIVALFLIRTSTGGIKSNISVLIFQQYTQTKSKVLTLESGERVIVDLETTISNISTRSSTMSLVSDVRRAFLRLISNPVSWFGLHTWCRFAFSGSPTPPLS